MRKYNLESNPEFAIFVDATETSIWPLKYTAPLERKDHVTKMITSPRGTTGTSLNFKSCLHPPIYPSSSSFIHRKTWFLTDLFFFLTLLLTFVSFPLFMVHWTWSAWWATIFKIGFNKTIPMSHTGRLSKDRGNCSTECGGVRFIYVFPFSPDS